MNYLDWLKLFAKGEFRQPELSAFLDWLEEKGDDRVLYIRNYHTMEIDPAGSEYSYRPFQSNNNFWKSESDAWEECGRELVLYLLRTDS